VILSLLRDLVAATAPLAPGTLRTPYHRAVGLCPTDLAALQPGSSTSHVRTDRFLLIEHLLAVLGASLTVRLPGQRRPIRLTLATPPADARRQAAASLMTCAVGAGVAPGRAPAYIRQLVATATAAAQQPTAAGLANAIEDLPDLPAALRAQGWPAQSLSLLSGHTRLVFAPAGVRRVQTGLGPFCTAARRLGCSWTITWRGGARTTVAAIDSPLQQLLPVSCADRTPLPDLDEVLQRVPPPYRSAIRTLLRGGSVKDACRRGGISKAYLYVLIKQCVRIDPLRWRTNADRLAAVERLLAAQRRGTYP
jgi:hypothetical protein